MESQDRPRMGSRIVELVESPYSPPTSAGGGDLDQDALLERLETVTAFEPLPPYLSPTVTGLFHDEIHTATSYARGDTLEQCLPLLTSPSSTGLPLNFYGIPRLARERHAAFLHNTLRPLPAPYVAADATRPWMFYWAISGLSSLGHNVSEYKERLIETLRPLQNPTGGFGGGHGHLSHCACSYAAVLSLASVDGLDMIDRKTMWQWLGTIKQADGGFRMAVGAEEDIRGAYCAMTIIALLNLPLALPPNSPARSANLELFTDRLGEWVGRCQTYEGGIAGAPGNEAHGAYAFCALACLSILDAPHISIPRYLQVDPLIHCLASLQTSPEGGFAGRTNKLVDACYSHWVGSCWSFLDTVRSSPQSIHPRSSNNTTTTTPEASSQSASPAPPKPHDLWNREALIRYTLACSQSPARKGGLRDKPSTAPDGYHTCYSLAGLSAAQNSYRYDSSATTIDADTGSLKAAFNWTAEAPDEERRRELGVERGDLVEFVHPVFVIGMDAVRRAESKFASGRF